MISYNMGGVSSGAFIWAQVCHLHPRAAQLSSINRHIPRFLLLLFSQLLKAVLPQPPSAWAEISFLYPGHTPHPQDAGQSSILFPELQSRLFWGNLQNHSQSFIKAVGPDKLRICNGLVFCQLDTS